MNWRLCAAAGFGLVSGITSVGGDVHAPAAVDCGPGEAVILTPKPPRTPRINGPKIFGVRPGSPFLFTIPATGDRPMRFSVEKLPAGLSVDSSSGQITGTLKERGEFVVTFKASNALGGAERKFKIVCSGTLALTPYMGWNSWYAWENQDPLGKPGLRVRKDGPLEVWAKEMEDGAKVVGLFNRGEMQTTVTAKWADLGLNGKQRVRDLWRQKDLGEFESRFQADVPRHGVALVRLRGP